ncbi:bifunctional phosphopantothenoylcysteine decarboxylase/phosphopantothenate--cysteine ligase CoaBC [Rothia sp. P13129]|uniref:bifunctional phosphopantothenoylcysteine decarboxylase/phosphopantothenate--cysteine ligase CoaBC n=1 Tax=Rothia sp. P13129 TaxID=3402664 RepID=UPI003AD7941E
MRIVIGIGGGIAAYKATSLLRLFSKAGHEVIAMPTETALNFVGKATFEALSGNPVATSVFERVPEVNHVKQAEDADGIVIAPATADLLSRLASGRADDLLSATVLTTHAPVILAPAMHTQMWEHPATTHNVRKLREYGYHVIEPAIGRLTGKDSGIGRMPEPEDIFEQALNVLNRNVPDGTGNQPFTGKHIVITAGGTREPLDPVRFLGNRSSGKQGVALARVAHSLGARVTLIGAHLQVPVPSTVERVDVSTTEELRQAVHHHSEGAYALIMAAAVADFRPAHYAEYKIKKTANDDEAPTIELVRNPDILREMVQRKEHSDPQAPKIIVGFAAETGSQEKTVLELGREKLQRKGCDYLAINQVGKTLGFGTDTNTVTLLSQDLATAVEVSGSKEDVAQALLLHIAQHVHKN